MTTGGIAALMALLVLAFVEGIDRFYPARRTWFRLRASYGYAPVRAMRERFEKGAETRTPRRISLILLVLVIVWVSVASLLDKRWYEVVLDVLPYVFIIAALFRTPPALRAVAERMKRYEREAGYDPDATPDDGPEELAL